MKRSIVSSARVCLVVLVLLVVLAGAGARPRWLGGLVHAAGVVNFIATDDVGPGSNASAMAAFRPGRNRSPWSTPAPTSRLPSATRAAQSTRFRAWSTRQALTRCRSISQRPSGRRARASRSLTPDSTSSCARYIHSCSRRRSSTTPRPPDWIWVRTSRWSTASRFPRAATWRHACCGRSGSSPTR